MLCFASLTDASASFLFLFTVTKGRVDCGGPWQPDVVARPIGCSRIASCSWSLRRLARNIEPDHQVTHYHHPQLLTIMIIVL